jgi:hypothetical protein
VRSIPNGTGKHGVVDGALWPSAGLHTNRENMARLSAEAAPGRLPETLAHPLHARASIKPKNALPSLSLLTRRLPL